MKKEMKKFNVIMPKELWAFLKKKAMDEETSMCQLIIKYVDKQKKKADKALLTNNDANV